MRLLEGANLFCLVGILLIAGLFVLGNYQEFLDESQLMLLGILSVFSVLCVASGLCYVVTLSVWMISRRHRMILRLLYGLFATVIGGLVATVTGALETIVRPL